MADKYPYKIWDRYGELVLQATEDCPMIGSPGRVSASDFCSYGERWCDNG